MFASKRKAVDGAGRGGKKAKDTYKILSTFRAQLVKAVQTDTLNKHIGSIALRFGVHELEQMVNETSSKGERVPWKPLLHMAAERGHTEALSLLLSELKMDVNHQDQRLKDTALHVAVREGRTACMKLLLESGADTSIISDDFNATALSLALRNHDVEAVKIIITTGQKHGSTVCSKDWVKDPEVHVATLDDDVVTLRRLLEQQADPNSVAKGGHTPLHIAAQFGRHAALEALLSAGADPTLVNEWLYIPLHFAAVGEESQCCVSLLAHPLHASCLNVRDKEWNTPLSLAVFYKREPQVRMLLSAGADPSLCYRRGLTLLHYCAQEGGAQLTAIMDLLLRHGARVDAHDLRGGTPLGSAIEHGQLGIASLLLKHGASLFARKTPSFLQPWRLLEHAMTTTDAPAEALAILREQLVATRAKLAALEDGTAELAKREVAKASAMASVAALSLSQLTGQDQLFATQDCHAKMAALRSGEPADVQPQPPARARERALPVRMQIESEEPQQPDADELRCPDWQRDGLLPPWKGFVIRPRAKQPERGEDALHDAPADADMVDWSGAGLLMETQPDEPVATQRCSAALQQAAAARSRLADMWVAVAQAAADYSDARLAVLRPKAVQAAIDEARAQAQALGKVLEEVGAEDSDVDVD